MKRSKSKSKKFMFTFEIEKERLLELSKMSIVARLNWLEEANHFINTVAGKSIRKRWELIRSGKI